MVFYLLMFALVMIVAGAYMLFGWLGALCATAVIAIGLNLDGIIKWWKRRHEPQNK